MYVVREWRREEVSFIPERREGGVRVKSMAISCARNKVIMDKSKGHNGMGIYGKPVLRLEAARARKGEGPEGGSTCAWRQMTNSHRVSSGFGCWYRELEVFTPMLIKNLPYHGRRIGVMNAD